MLYPQFTQGNQTNFQNMLTTGWQGLLNSSLYNKNTNKFSFVDTSANVPGNYNDEATLLGAMTLFLYGITPQTGHLNITATEERYHDYRTNFPTTQWQFNYTNHTIRIPITQGTLTFNFGTQKTTQHFPQDGTYDIQFSNDWNTITTIKLTTNTTSTTPTPPPETNPPTPTTPPQNNTTNPPTTPTTTNPPTTTPNNKPSQWPVPFALYLAAGLTVTVAVSC